MMLVISLHYAMISSINNDVINIVFSYYFIHNNKTIFSNALTSPPPRQMAMELVHYLDCLANNRATMITDQFPSAVWSRWDNCCNGWWWCWCIACKHVSQDIENTTIHQKEITAPSLPLTMASSHVKGPSLPLETFDGTERWGSLWKEDSATVGCWFHCPLIKSMIQLFVHCIKFLNWKNHSDDKAY